MIHHPLDFALETSPSVALSQKRETFVAVNPTDLRCAEQVLNLPESHRDCIDPEDYEETAYEYRQSTCLLECLREAVHETCECHPYFLPEETPTNERHKELRYCNAVDGICLAKNYGELIAHYV